jgi:hypothetical protein
MTNLSEIMDFSKIQGYLTWFDTKQAQQPTMIQQIATQTQKSVLYFQNPTKLTQTRLIYSIPTVNKYITQKL